MILDRTHRLWMLLSLVALLLGGVTYAVYAGRSAGPSGGSVPGLLYGLIGTGMMIFAGLLAARRQVPTWRIGSAQFWLRGHIWLGLLSVAFILFHAGFRWGGPVEIGLWIVTVIIVATGVVGLALQQVLPHLLTNRVQSETFVDQVPYLCKSMQFLADKLIAETCEEKLDVIGEDVVDVAEEVARQRKWLKRDGDLQKLFDSIYESPPQVDPAGTPAAKKSPAPMATTSAKSGEIEADKPKSPLELAREQAAAAKPGEGEAEKPKSPLELAREQAAAAKSGEGEAEKPKSPLELAREQAAAAKAAAAGEDESGEASEGGESDKPKSPLELAREQAAAAKSGEGESEKPKSPLELAREQAAAAKGKPTSRTKPGGKSPGKPRSTTVSSIPRREPPAAAKPKDETPPLEVYRKSELKSFYQQSVRPYLAPGRVARLRLSHRERRRAAFGQVRSALPTELRPALESLEEYCEERSQMKRMLSIHRWLHGWLYLHVPVSAALLILFLIHVVVSLRVVPWPW